MKFFENNRFTYGKTFFGKHYVIDKSTGVKLRPTAEELDKLGRVFMALRRIPLGPKATLQSAEINVYLAFCLSVHGVDEAWQVFMRQSPTECALVFGTMPPVR